MKVLPLKASAPDRELQRKRAADVELEFVNSLPETVIVSHVILEDVKIEVLHSQLIK